MKDFTNAEILLPTTFNFLLETTELIINLVIFYIYSFLVKGRIIAFLNLLPCSNNLNNLIDTCIHQHISQVQL